MSGRVIRYTKVGPHPARRSATAEYTWEKGSNGLCLLQAYKYKDFNDVDMKEALISYSLDIKNLRIIQKTPSELTFKTFVSYLPENVAVFDHQTKRRYYLKTNKTIDPRDGFFKRNAQTLKSRGFLLNR